MSSANSGKSTLAAKVYEAEQHITVLEENEKLENVTLEQFDNAKKTIERFDIQNKLKKGNSEFESYKIYLFT